MLFNDEYFKKIPFFNSFYQDFDKVEEALFLIKKNVDPYEYSTIFHVFFNIKTQIYLKKLFLFRNLLY